MLDSLIHILNRAGKLTELYKSPDGSSVLLLPHGGRVLGLFAPHSQNNFFWTNPALDAAESARAFFEGEAWQNSGGDRTWLAPEVDWFCPDFPDLSKYWQPRELDPGNYKIVRQGDTVFLVNQLTLSSSRSKLRAELEITKWAGPALNPLRHEPLLSELAEIQYAGYTLHTSLRFTDTLNQASLKVGLWNLLQLPHGGELVIPTYSRTQPKIFFGEVDPEDLMVGDHLVRYQMQASGEHKMGFHAADTPGRVGYLYGAGDQSVLVVRNFSVNPSAEYIDVPWRETTDVGYSIQSCNVNSALGTFSELEYHAPAIGENTGNDRSDDVSQVWAFRGPRSSIQAIAKRLLAAEV